MKENSTKSNTHTRACIWCLLQLGRLQQHDRLQHSCGHCNRSQWYESRAAALAFISRPLLGFQRHGLIPGQVSAPLCGPSPTQTTPSSIGPDPTPPSVPFGLTFRPMRVSLHMQSQQLQMSALIISASDSMYCKTPLSDYTHKMWFDIKLTAKHSLGQRFQNSTRTRKDIPRSINILKYFYTKTIYFELFMKQPFAAVMHNVFKIPKCKCNNLLLYELYSYSDYDVMPFLFLPKHDLHQHM